MKGNNKNILIIGMSQMGKTNLGGQLYGQLKSLDYTYLLRETPDDLSLFEEALNRLNEGFEVNHTSTQLHKTLLLPIESKDKSETIDLVYPDYGGEQIRNIVEQRQIPENWQKAIQNSNHWFLLINLDAMEKIADITTKFYQQIEEEDKTEDKEKKVLSDLIQNSAAFYVELLQIFLHTKNPKQKPQLTVLLSLWDRMKFEAGKQPSVALAEVMPLLFSYIKNNWAKENHQILGLSSLGRDLYPEKADMEMANKGPENFCYYILPSGDKENDITKLLDDLNP